MEETPAFDDIYDSDNEISSNFPVSCSIKKTKFEQQPFNPDFNNNNSLSKPSNDVELISIEPGTLEDEEGFLSPCVYISGRSSSGKSVQLTCTDFYPYFYFETGFEVTNEELEQIREQIEVFLLKHVKNKPTRKPVVNIEQIFDKSSLVGFSEKNSIFIKITLGLPHFVVKVRTFIETDNDFSIQGHSHFKTYESSFEFILRWMVDTDARGGGWIEFNPTDSLPVVEKTSFCDEEYIIQTSKLTCRSIDERYSHADLKILSFDIECVGRKGQFPEATRDKVIQIAATTEIFQKPETNHTTVFVLGSCNRIEGSTVFSYETEEEFLLGFRDFFVNFDPDIVMGYNINNFDWPYLIKRAQTLRLDRFQILSRRRDLKCKCFSAKFESKAYGKRDSFKINLFGRWNIDIFQEISRDHKLRSYKLNNVSQHFLGDQKEDVHYSQITPLFNGTAEDRTTLAKYCIKDAELPLRLFHKLMLGFKRLEMSRVTIVPPYFLSDRGQAIKVLTQIYWEAKTRNKLVPKGASVDVDTTYVGATVFNPIRGFYKKPIATLDFASLYPSIMIAHNLCYSTLVKVPNEKTFTTPIKAHFIKSEFYEGLLPSILKKLLAKRKEAKIDLAKETDPQKQSILDGRQLALKVSANSVYGFTGAAVGKLPCFEISASVTSIGRGMIGKTAEIVCEKYSRKNGFEHDARIIYGDTDSVMVDFGLDTVKEALSRGKEAAAYVTQFFPPPAKLEFEKVYYPYLLINKKRYAGYFWTKDTKPDKLDAKGIESVRRDNCKLLSNTVKDCIQLMLDKQSPELAAEFVKETIRKLLMSEINVSDLVITKQLSKNAEEYDTKGPHIILAQKLLDRDPATAPRVGDRVPYVLIKGDKKMKAYELAEDPLYVIKQGLDIDYDRYIENCFRKPMERIFAPLMKDTESLFKGKHTLVQRNLPKPQRTQNNGKLEIRYDEKKTMNQKKPRQTSLLSFLTIQGKCKKCGNLTDSGKVICKNCIGETGKIKSELLLKKERTEKALEEMKNKCFNCSGKRDTLESCSSVDCNQFYSRFVTKFQLDSIVEDLRKLSF